MLGRDYHCGKGSDPKPRYSHRHLTWMAQSGKNVYDSSFTSQITWRILDWGRPHVSRLTLTLLKLLLVNLKDLETAQGSFQLLPDEQEGEYPGLLIHTKQNAKKVAYYVDGKLRQRAGELQIYMIDRDAIGRITPALLQTINIAQEKQ